MKSFGIKINARTIKVLVGVKIVVIVAILAQYKGGFHIGDRFGFAADGDKIEEEVPDMTPDKDGFVDGDKKKSKSKSVLDQLFNLPKLEPEKLQKEEIDRYLTLIERKTQQVQERINFLKDREDKLQKMEGAIDDKLRKLDDERRFFGDTLQKEKDLSGERMDKLVDYYQKMAPKKAAPVFEKLNKDLVVELFKRLPQKQITAILELMPPEKSVELTEYYGRLRSGREYDMLKELNKSLRDEFAECKTNPAS